MTNRFWSLFVFASHFFIFGLLVGMLLLPDYMMFLCFTDTLHDTNGGSTHLDWVNSVEVTKPSDLSGKFVACN